MASALWKLYSSRLFHLDFSALSPSLPPSMASLGFMMGTPDAKQQEQIREAKYSDI